MNAPFLAACAALIALGLAFVLVPLVRASRGLPQRRGVYALALGLAFVLPLATMGLYRLLGTPAALVPGAEVARDLTPQQAIADLRRELDAHPNDADGWSTLGQAYAAMQQPANAADAFARALKLRPDDADLLVAWAEADSMASPQHHISDLARSRLQRAVTINPEHQRGLWLLGISDFQRGRYADAVAVWQRLLPLLPAGSQIAQAVSQQVALAQTRGGLPVTAPAAGVAPAAATPTTAANAAAAPRLQIDVGIAPALAARIPAGAVLFVFARAPNGPPMPLAVRKLPARLPATVVLTDGMGMSPALTLSSVPDVVITARISASGQPLPQTGDLEGRSATVSVRQTTPVAVTIDKVL